MGVCPFHACVASSEATRGHWVSLGLELQMTEDATWRPAQAAPGRGFARRWRPAPTEPVPRLPRAFPSCFARHEDPRTTPLGIYGVTVAKCAGVLKH